MYFDKELFRVRSVGNEFQKSRNDSFKGEREMSVCEMEKNAAIARRNLANARREFQKKLAEARRLKVKLSKDVLNTKTSDAISVGIGKAYCALLAQLKVKSLGAQALTNPKPPKRPPSLPQNVTPEILKRMQGPQGMQSHPGAPATPLDSGLVVAAEIPGQLEGIRIRVEDARRTENAYEVEIQKKFALAAACFVFLLLGPPIALRFPRGGVGLTIGVSLVVFALYYVGLIAGESLARRGIVPPVVSMWGANIIFTAIALWLLARMGKEDTSGRRGDLSDLLESIRSRFRLSRKRRRAPMPAPRPSAT
jgi:lipopolysaccharide export system permease protein